ncbi:EAL domain-containing protein [Leptospira sp. 85282-16]|uniref:EAL domain-containing protein n=1 Tax=Leptospira sp. 85282-16 TaxID=2971256 RepID=UPI0021BEB28B|nr:EAL domain-containing protein [Leptospira sp. 85282-16]MCT8335358.1 EAL domain-containing protein [Leptospira sp. 85282-16]
MTEMAGKLQIKCMAEGVETKIDCEQLKSMKCDIGQGYFIAKPMSLDDFLIFCNLVSEEN